MFLLLYTTFNCSQENNQTFPVSLSLSLSQRERFPNSSSALLLSYQLSPHFLPPSLTSFSLRQEGNWLSYIRVCLAPFILPSYISSVNLLGRHCMMPLQSSSPGFSAQPFRWPGSSPKTPCVSYPPASLSALGSLRHFCFFSCTRKHPIDFLTFFHAEGFATPYTDCFSPPHPS